MRVGQSPSGQERKKDKKLGRKKHKRLDAICEKAYTRNHSGVGQVELSVPNVGGDEAELRRSSRVRKAPVLLDTSPPPAKKRRKTGRQSGMNSIGSVKEDGGVKRELARSSSMDLEESLGEWTSRLRSRPKTVGSKARREAVSSPKGKRKLFDDFKAGKEESRSEDEELDEIGERTVPEKLTVVKSQGSGRVTASNVSEDEPDDIDLGGELDNGKGSCERREREVRKEVDAEKNTRELLDARDEGDKENSERESLEAMDEKDGEESVRNEGDEEAGEKEAVEAMDQEGTLPLRPEIELENLNKKNDGNAAFQLIDVGKCEVESEISMNEREGKDKSETIEENRHGKEQACTVGVDQRNPMEVDESIADKGKDGRNSDKALQKEALEKSRKRDNNSDGPPGRLRIKEGRHCGLCGTGCDGKPPKKLSLDGAGSESEAYSGSSASEEPNYDQWDGFGDDPGWLGRLLGPINDRFGIAGIWVHQQCAVWSPEACLIQ